jgi:hypothetical protein
MGVALAAQQSGFFQWLNWKNCFPDIVLLLLLLMTASVGLSSY